VQGRFGEEEKHRFHSCLLLPEESIEPIIGKVEGLCRADRNYIIEGFPKNLRQAHLLQQRKLSPKNLLIINVDSAGLESLIGEKVAQLNPTLSAEERGRLVATAKMEHEM
jgi:adenylate kinase family enzyme